MVAELALPIVAILIVGAGDPNGVKIEHTSKGVRLLRNGDPYFIKGAGGHAHMNRLVEAGGNSVRTWHAENMEKCLDDAHKAGLSVTMGIWLGHERHGFDYGNEKSLEEQRERVAVAINKYKSHPALLMWGIGNEMEGDGKNPAIWREINTLAELVEKLDPNHPTMTVIAGGGEKLAQFDKHCPAVDILGINSYGDLSGLAADIRSNGFSRPFALTEFGPTGWWQVAKTSWGEEFEPTSSEKEQTYLKAYQTIVEGFPRQCIGSYAFLWGHKQEHTHTWFGMFLPTGERTPAVDAMTFAWTGKWPSNRCPKVSGLQIRPLSSKGKRQGAAELIFPPRTELQCSVKCRDPDNDALNFIWELRSASTDKRSGGDAEKAPSAHPDAIVTQSKSAAVIRCPETPGAYRVFVSVLDPSGNAGTANLPILVREHK